MLALVTNGESADKSVRCIQIARGGVIDSHTWGTDLFSLDLIIVPPSS